MIVWRVNLEVQLTRHATGICGSEQSENSVHYSQRQRYIVSMLQLFSHLIVFKTRFDSYFYDFLPFHFDRYFAFHSISFVNFFVAILYVFCKSRFYAVTAFF